MIIPCNLFRSRRSIACFLGALPIASLAALSCAGPQAAAPALPRPPSGLAPEGTHLAALLEFLDRNDDGKVEAYEGAEAMLLLTAEADANGDAGLDLDELAAFLIASGRRERQEVESTFAEFDTDGDGLLTVAEVPEDLAPMILSADADGSESVSLDELLASDMFGDPMAEFEQELLGFLDDVDQDGDGAFSLDDLPVSERQGFTEDFGELDKNADGTVTREELLSLLEDEMRGATFEVEGQFAYMNGVIGPTTPGRVLELVLEHPEVDTIVMIDVPGSMDDDSMVRAADLVRRMGFATHMPSHGEVASGGTDFFLAGATRSAEEGARFGVHSWSGFNEEGADLPRDNPEHELYLDFYRTMEISEDFYWFTLEAAPADGIHWMTAEELEEYGFFHTEDSQESGPMGRDFSYGLDAIEIPKGVPGIASLPESVHGTLREHFDRYSRVTAPNGRPIHILAQKDWTNDQILHVRKVLEHFLTDAPGSLFGSDKSPVADAMSERRATMVLFNNVDEMELAFEGELGELHLSMQDLRANECTAPGDPEYMRHGTRDATYEEVLHLVHDYGIRPVLPEYDELLHEANLHATSAGLWSAWPEDEPETHRNEYFAAAYDNYLDLWTLPPTLYEGEVLGPEELPLGMSHFGAFACGSRAKLRELDPQGFALMEMFHPKALTYTAELPVDFEGTFHLDSVPGKRYTTKTRHLVSVRLRGSSHAGIVGNRHDNSLTGNAGDNELTGSGGDDLLQGGEGQDVAIFHGMRSEYELVIGAVETTVVDQVPNRDGSDRLRGIEHIRFQDGPFVLAE
jgi:Ca2+-binding EF-hand superfamily protein